MDEDARALALLGLSDAFDYMAAQTNLVDRIRDDDPSKPMEERRLAYALKNVRMLHKVYIERFGVLARSENGAPPPLRFKPYFQ